MSSLSEDFLLDAGEDGELTVPLVVLFGDSETTADGSTSNGANQETETSSQAPEVVDDPLAYLQTSAVDDPEHDLSTQQSVM